MAVQGGAPPAADALVPGGVLRRAPRGGRRRWTFDRASLVAVFLGVPFVAYVVLVLSPFLQAAWFSLTDWSGFSPQQDFVGLANYARLLDDALFLKAVGNSLLLLVVLPVLTLTLSYALACVLTFGGRTSGGVRGLRGSSFYRVVSFFPYVMPAIVIGIIWSRIFDPSTGLLNGLLTGVGLSGFKDFAWLGDPRTAMGASIAVIVWGFVGFYMLLFVAALRSVPEEIFEAARLDGAGRWRTAVSIALPSVTSGVRTAYIYMGIFALDAFVYIQALNPDGGPGNSTLVITQQIYTTAFRKGQFGLACAMGVTLALLTFLFVVAVQLTGRRSAKDSR